MLEKPVSFDSLPPVLTPEQMREADQETIASIGIGGFTLMEVAGRAVAAAALRLAGKAPTNILCFCGTGNNGGDGFVASRVLIEAGVTVRVVLAGEEEKITGDARTHFDIMCKVGSGRNSFSLIKILDESGQHEAIVNATEEINFSHSDVIIDALAGTGLEDAVRGRFQYCIAAINDSTAPVLAVDIPSGLSGFTGRILGNAVRASETVVMAALKRGLIIEDGPSCTGKLSVVEIGIPDSVLYKTRGTELSVALMETAYAQSRRIKRDRKSHKYTTGPTIIFAGSVDYTGAPVLAATAAARSGSGYVICVCPPSIHTLLAEKLTEIPVTPWVVVSDQHDPGTAGSADHNNSSSPVEANTPDAHATRKLIGDHFQKCRAFLLGPGLGRSPGITHFVLSLLEAIAETPRNCAVIDADGIVAISGQKERIKSLSGGKWILTPHAGEARLLDDSNNRDSTNSGSKQADRSVVEYASRLATEWNCVVLLKGFPSVTAAPDGRVMINNSSLAAAATAGTGDVLAGIVSGLAAQGLDAFDAAVCGIYRASKLAEKYVESHPPESMMASDLLAHLEDEN